MRKRMRNKRRKRTRKIKRMSKRMRNITRKRTRKIKRTRE